MVSAQKKYAMRWGSVYDKLRDRAHSVLGGVCARCGFSDRRALQIDHVDGDGWRARKGGKSGGHGTPLFKLVIESAQKGENRYQLLCANCNWIKKHENDERRNQYELEEKRTSSENDGPLFGKR